MANKRDVTICGRLVQHDASGQGHAWKAVTADELPSDIAEDISAVIRNEIESPMPRTSLWTRVCIGGEHFRF